MEAALGSAPKANGPIQIKARVGGEIITLQIRDLQSVNIMREDGSSISILPGTVGRCLQLGADALAAEKLVKNLEEMAQETQRPLVIDADAFLGRTKSV